MERLALLSLVAVAVTWFASDVSAADTGALPLKESVSQYGITWQFGKAVPVGQFVTGDYYVVGPVTIVSVTPRTLRGAEVTQPTERETRKYEGKYVRHGSMLNPPTSRAMGYDSRFQNNFDPNLAVTFPLEMKPGDSLVSTISLDKPQQNQVFPNPTKSSETSVLRTAAVLTCLSEAVPADAFRPSYCDLKKDRIHRASDIHWELLPSVQRTESAPDLAELERVFQRPWIDHVYDWDSRTLHPSENMPGYGREVARAVSIAALALCSDYTRDQKETLCQRMIQVGIDNWGVAKRSKLRESGGWPAAGGFGNGRKFPIVFAGVMLQDEEMLHIRKYAPEASFGEDEHTAFGKSWTGADVLFTGQYPLIGDRAIDRGPYEHLTPDKWPGNNPTMSEGYRRCCTSISWIGEALATHLMGAVDVWDHDAFFAYCDRWMTQDDTPFVKIMNEAHPGRGFRPQQRTTWDPFVNEMWAKYRNNLPPAPGRS